jgi:glycosyltransferase involved in cell wall biosynthesis
LIDPLISICIPAYKRTQLLIRLLDSIAVQTYKQFEVIITDDSNDNSVELLVASYNNKFSLNYAKNHIPLGSPENWNAAVRKAKGTWIKLMHDDDWFSSIDSLQRFVDAVKQYSKISFFFSAYYNIKEDTSQKRLVSLTSVQKVYLDNPVRLLANNVIGPPSVTLYRNTKQFTYDQSLKWLVDMDFYMQYLREGKAHYIEQPLINIGINEQQVTKYSFRVKEVEVPEHFHVLNKIGYKNLKDIIVFDAIWRLIRNLHIRGTNDIQDAGYTGEVHKSIITIIHHQNTWGRNLLKNGVFSKILMLLSYIKNRNNLPDQ